MQSRHLITASLLAATCAIAAAQHAPVLPADPDTAQVPETVADLGRGVHVITGRLNNTTVVKGPRGLIVIDTQFAPRYQAIPARIAAISTKPVLYVVNTHYHYDHIGGNAQFHAHGARIFAHANVARRMAAPPVNPLIGLPDVPAPPDAMPNVHYATSQRSTTLGGIAVRLIHPALAHTDGDTVLVLPGRDVVATGDIVGNHYPNIDVAVGGSIDGTIAATTAIIALLNDRTRVVPGHGPVLGKAEVIAYRDMLRTARDRIARAKAAGMTERQVLAANLLADLDPRWKGPSPMANRFPINVYRSLP